MTFPDAAVRVVTDCNNSCKPEEFFIGDSGTDENALAASLHSSLYSSEVDWTSVAGWFHSEIGQSGPLERFHTALHFMKLADFQQHVPVHFLIPTGCQCRVG